VSQSFSPIVQIVICILSCLSATTALAQVNPDNTLDTQVQTQGNVSEITGGQTRGSNLFHSFQDFSVETGSEAFFNNANNISTIFSRVTGDNISQIDGLIRANGSADLFLINPNGIIFGENAQLNIGGSFLGSTASSILFEDGEFSATDLDSPPLLTINAPIGLGLPDNPGAIVNRSRVEDSEANPVGLSVLAGNNFSLVGGEINFEGGNATAAGGNVELGGLSTAGTIGISEDGGLTFPEDVAKADIALSDGAKVEVAGTGGGNITVNARNLDLTVSSFLEAGITVDSTSSDAQAGDIVINVTDNLTLDESRITNQVNQDGVGNSGNIDINTGSLTAINGGEFDSSTSGQGNAGSIEIIAKGDMTFDGATSEGDRSGAVSRVNSDGEGNAGGVTISTNNLTLTNGGRVDSSTKGQGNAGLVEIIAKGDMTFDGATSGGDRSGVTSRVDSDGEGNAGGVTISTTNLTLTNGGRVDSSTKGIGDADLVEIIAKGDMTFDGATSEGDRSGVTSRVDSDGEGNAGGVTISANNLTLTNGGRVDSSTSGQGNAGSIEIVAKGDMTFDGTTSEGDRSGVTSRVNQDGKGNVGDITISTTNLNLINGGRVDTASTRGTGDGGSIKITATKDITLRNNSPISAQASEKFNGGNIIIDARFIIAFPESTNQEQEKNLAIDSLSLFGNDIIASAEQGQGGNININTKSLFGIEERPLSNSTNDINASSEFGLSGTVEINILEVDPSRESLKIPVEPVQAEVNQTCEINSTGNQSEFVVTGGGGLPPEPEDNFRLPTLATDENTPESQSFVQQSPAVPPPIIEATGWVRNAKGNIVLVASPSQASSLNSHSNPGNCNS
jgi:filamentous hemagglutinin family protein